MAEAPRPLRRHLLEAVTIVASILFALWVDASWDEYQDRQREARYLEGLVVEFDAAATELAADQRVRKGILGSFEAALAPASGVPSDEARLAASDPDNLVRARFYTPSHPNLEDLVASGNLQILRSEALRTALLSYTQERDRLVEVEQRYRDYVTDNVEPYVLAHANLGNHPPGTDSRDQRPLDLALWNDPRFVNLVWLGHARLETVASFGDLLGERIEAVRRALDGARGADGP